MPNLNEAISIAVKVQAIRKGKTLTHIATKFGSRTSFWNRLNGETPWNTEDCDKLSQALGLRDSWQLIDIARSEAAIAANEPDAHAHTEEGFVESEAENGKH